MSLNTANGTFTAITAGGPTQAITGLGFQPKLVILFSNGRTTTGASAGGDTVRSCTGFATSATQRGCQAISQLDASNTEYMSWREALALELLNTDGTAYAAADLVSMDADGFTITWPTLPAAAINVNYVAIGGADVTNTKVGFFGANTSGGNPIDQSVTGVGFKPDAILLFSIAQTADNIYNTGISASYSAGMASGASNEMAVYSNTGDTGNIIYTIGTKVAKLKTFDADGFTLTWQPAGFSAYRIGYIAIKGPLIKVVTDTSPLTNGNQSKTGVGFQPQILFAIGPGGQNATPNATSMRGVATGTSVRRVSTFNLRNSNPARSLSDLETNLFLRFFNTSATSTQNLVGDADLVSLNSDGYTLNWTNTDGTHQVTFAVLAIASIAKKSFVWKRNASRSILAL